LPWTISGEATMGDSIKYTCQKCGYTRDVCLGVGMLHHRVVQETYDEIARGKYGLWLRLGPIP